MRQIVYIYLIVLCIALAVCACRRPPVTEQPPSPTTVPAEESVEGRSGPKRGEATPMPGLPLKDKGELLPPINGQAGPKRPSEQIELVEPGALYEQGERNAKPPPGGIEGQPGRGPKEPLPPSPEVGRYARIQFRMTADEIVPESLLVLAGDLLSSATIDGEFMYVVTMDGKPLHVGTFRDPLVAVGLPQEPEQGYSLTRMPEGFFGISIPGGLLDRDVFVGLSFEFHRLDPAVPYTTPLTLDAVPELIERSQSFARLDGAQVLELLEEGE